MENEDLDEAWMKQNARAAARRRRKFSYVVRRIRSNDPVMTSLFENFRCESLGGDVAHSLLKAMERNTRVTSLTIANCSNVASSCAMMLSKNCSLKHLTLLDSQISWVGGVPLFRAIASNTSLQSLNLSNNKLLFRDGSKLLVDAICKNLPQMIELKVLNLSNTGLTGPAVQAIFRGLERNSSIQSLDVSQNSGVAQAVVDSLVQSLPRMNGLERLDVQMTNISAYLDQNTEAMVKIVNSLKKNSRLWKLDYIVLHRIEHYSTSKEQETQRRCFELLNELRYIKRRNGLLAGQLLRMDQQALWPRILEHISPTHGGGDFRNDMVYYLLQEKSDLLLPRSFMDGPFQATAVKRRKSTNKVSKKNTGNGRKQPSQCCRHPKNDDYSPGFRCQIHGGIRLIPAECCTFEQMQPFRKRLCLEKS